MAEGAAKRAEMLKKKEELAAKKVAEQKKLENKLAKEERQRRADVHCACSVPKVNYVSCCVEPRPDTSLVQGES